MRSRLNRTVIRVFETIWLVSQVKRSEKYKMKINAQNLLRMLWTHRSHLYFAIIWLYNKCYLS